MRLTRLPFVAAVSFIRDGCLLETLIIFFLVFHFEKSLKGGKVLKETIIDSIDLNCR